MLQTEASPVFSLGYGEDDDRDSDALTFYIGQGNVVWAHWKMFQLHFKIVIDSFYNILNVSMKLQLVWFRDVCRWKSHMFLFTWSLFLVEWRTRCSGPRCRGSSHRNARGWPSQSECASWARLEASWQHLLKNVYGRHDCTRDAGVQIQLTHKTLK